MIRNYTVNVTPPNTEVAFNPKIKPIKSDTRCYNCVCNNCCNIKIRVPRVSYKSNKATNPMIVLNHKM